LCPGALDVTISNADKLITVVGGSGFVGRQIVRSLAKRGYRVRVACRRPDLAGHVTTAGFPGQVALVQANVRFPASLQAACEGAYAVINATGTDVSSGAQTFDAVLVFGAEAVAKAAKAAKAQLLITLSGIGASPESSSAASVAKAQGEAAAAKAFPGAIALRPSVIFGPDDRFFNKAAAMARFLPVLPLVGGGESKVQPVYVGDVAEAAASLIDRGVADGKVYELGGPDVLSMREAMQFVLDTVQRKGLLVPLGKSIARMAGAIAGLLPKPLLTMDQVELLSQDNVVSAEATRDGRTLAGLGITARGIKTIVPSYLYRFRKEGQFTVPSGTPE